MLRIDVIFSRNQSYTKFYLQLLYKKFDKLNNNEQ